MPPAIAISILPERIPLVLGIWIEPSSDPGHAAHLDPVSTLLDHLRRDYPATPFRLLVPPLVAQAGWLRQVATKTGCPVSLAAEVEPGRPVLETLVRRSDLVLCLSPAPEQSEETKALIRWKREGRVARPEGEPEPIPAGPVEYWDLSRGGRARREHLGVVAKGADFPGLARHVWSFNQRTSKLGSTLADSMAKEREVLVPEDSVSRLTPGQNATLERFAANSAIAAHFEPLARVARITWMTLTGLTSVAFGVAATVPPGTAGRIHEVAFLTAWMLFALALISGGLRARWRRLFVHHKALAESMRTHFVRCVAGLPILEAAQFPMSRPGSPRWLRTAIASWTWGLAQAEPVTPATSDRIRLLRDHWLKTRCVELVDRAVLAEQRRKQFRNLTRGTGVLLAGCAIGLAAQAAGLIPMNAPLVTATILALALASVFSQAASRLRQSVQRSRREERAFTAAVDTLAGEVPAAVRMIDALSAETLQENADWAVNERERGLTPVFR
jgi:hypothetical protein